MGVGTIFLDGPSYHSARGSVSKNNLRHKYREFDMITYDAIPRLSPPASCFNVSGELKSQLIKRKMVSKYFLINSSRDKIQSFPPCWAQVKALSTFAIGSTYHFDARGVSGKIMMYL